MALPNMKGIYNVSDGFVNLRIKEDVLKRILNQHSPDITTTTTTTTTTATIQPTITTSNETTTEHLHGLSSDTQALLYIIIVLLFYAFSMIILLVKYVRREHQEAILNYYYYEFVQRKHFHTARYHNKTTVMSLMKQTLPLWSLMNKYDIPPTPIANPGTNNDEEGDGVTAGTSASTEETHGFKVTTV
ncbi:unnamed protein product [Owenia fusiformis]|uniref:Uncharacterized protein n=1 Tax=Owenia fusiformis TaxID=6347 RepID=A0A8S4MYQ3_OWEFU|nr:unnamed protein product [Owenia fusiformis]